MKTINEIKEEYELEWCNGKTLKELEGQESGEELLAVQMWNFFLPYLINNSSQMVSDSNPGSKVNGYGLMADGIFIPAYKHEQVVTSKEIDVETTVKLAEEIKKDEENGKYGPKPSEWIEEKIQKICVEENVVENNPFPAVQAIIDYLDKQYLERQSDGK